MIKKKILLALFISAFAFNATAMVGFKVESLENIGTLKIKDNIMLITDKKEDFIVLYNQKNEVIYYKHKNLDATYKVAASKILEKLVSLRLYQNNSKLVLENYKTKLSTAKINRQECFQVYGSDDLYGALGKGSGISSMYNLYKGFVYMTGLGEVKSTCSNVNLSQSLDKKIGMPLALFYKSKQFKLVDMQNQSLTMQKYLESKGLNMKKALAPTLKLQYEMMFSLLSEKQQEIFLKTSLNKPIDVKIRAISNLLRGF